VRWLFIDFNPEAVVMPTVIVLINFTDQGICNVKQTIKN
jgi:uncharacterized protein with GYD domain